MAVGIRLRKVVPGLLRGLLDRYLRLQAIISNSLPDTSFKKPMNNCI
jgi:hypothetical protein